MRKRIAIIGHFGGNEEFLDGLGDYLLETGKITREQYDQGQAEAKQLIASQLR